PELRYGAQFLVPSRTLAPGEAHTERFRLYAGPKDLPTLRTVDETLTSLIELGFFGFFARILLWLLELFYGLVGNWGLSIVLLTVLVKLLFFPLTQMSFKSSQAMTAIQPELTRLREELKDNQEELNRRMVALFRENGVNPLGGCLPMLVQMPIWFALYSVLL